MLDITDKTVFFARVKEKAILPNKRVEDAGYDIFPCIEEKCIEIRPLETVKIPTGIASACSPDYYFQLHERGSTGLKGISQRSGVIDSGFRGEWFIPVTNLNNDLMVIVNDDFNGGAVDGIDDEKVIIVHSKSAICQAVLLPVPRVEVVEISYEELKSIHSERGINQNGSSNTLH